ncbi:MAG TPA: pilus assembly protein TadG-related protein [Candidatus Limnocylindrales bacterium]|nr:pilus assembly protein TadG-related protein [Candidatus Limnocylindrales bacterium]
MSVRRSAERGQVLVIFSLLIVILLAFAGMSVDIGRQQAERRYVQTAADAAALAGCRELIEGSSDAAAAATARQVAEMNLGSSPSGTNSAIAETPTYADLDGNGVIETDEMSSGILVSSSGVRVAISGTMDTMLARLVGVSTFDVGARARCALQGGPALPIVARRYTNPSGPGGGFVDHMATASTSQSGAVDPSDPRGYGGRTPAGEGANAGPTFVLYGTDSKAVNDSSFRGFVALDVRNFEAENSRVYYNGVTSGTNVNTLKDMQSAYIAGGYPGPAFPPVATPPTGDTQVGVTSGHSNSFVVGEFTKTRSVGERLLLAVYDGTVMEIPDFSIQVPSNPVVVPASTTSPFDIVDPVTVKRNNAFTSTVTLRLLGDTGAVAAGQPQRNILPDPVVSPPEPGFMTEPIFSPNVFVPNKNGTNVKMEDVETNAIPPGIYTVWVEGQSGNPYYKTRRQPMAVKVNGTGTGANGPVNRDFSLTIGSGETNATIGGTLSFPVWLKTPNQASTTWGGGGVAMSWDPGSFTTCSLSPTPMTGSIGFSPTSVTPTSSGSGSSTTMTISTAGLAQGCYQFTVRATGTNGDNQPVTRLAVMRFTVATTSSSGQYVDIIGFGVFEVMGTTANSIDVRAVSPIRADPGDDALRRAQRARLVPWSSP